MSIVNISKDELMDYGLPWEGYDEVKIIEDKVVDNDRWSIHHEVIFKWIDGNTYQACYSVGATELQDESPWEYEDKVKCVKVELRDVVVSKWVEV